MRAPTPIRWIIALIAMAVMLFAMVGFLATLEPGPNRLAWRLAYGTIIFACLGLMMVAMRRPN